MRGLDLDLSVQDSSCHKQTKAAGLVSANQNDNRKSEIDSDSTRNEEIVPIDPILFKARRNLADELDAIDAQFEQDAQPKTNELQAPDGIVITVDQDEEQRLCKGMMKVK